MIYKKRVKKNINDITIGYDARALNLKGGSYTYAYNVLDNLNHTNVILYGTSNFHKFTKKPTIIKNTNPLRLFYENILLPIYCKRDKIDILHGLKGSIPYFGNFKKVITVHDIGGTEKSQKIKNILTATMYWKYVAIHYIKRADKIIVVSNHTKKDLIERHKINPNKITVIHESYNETTYKLYNKKMCKEEVEKYIEDNKINIKNLPKNIILNVNTIQPRKNILGLIKAYELFADKYPDSILIICGKFGWNYQDILSAYNTSRHKKSIHFLGFVPDEITAYLYNIATVFVYPSFYEGFGIPILESQACGCPVITSNVSSMPEILGEGGILINPLNVKDIANAIISVSENEKYRSELIKKGFKNIKKFSWKKCVEETQKVYEGLLK